MTEDAASCLDSLDVEDDRSAVAVGARIALTRNRFVRITRCAAAADQGAGGILTGDKLHDKTPDSRASHRRIPQKPFVERDGKQHRFFEGCFGIFGHGNVAGIGQALEQDPGLPYYLFRNEQAMVHAAAAFAKSNRFAWTMVCTSSIGPGATNMVTGAALATINRLPVLLLPGDIFARRNVAPVLQQLESPATQDISVNDCFKPVSSYWDRIERPEQILTSLPEAMRVLTSPAETGAVLFAFRKMCRPKPSISPMSFFSKRVWTMPRTRCDRIC